MPRRLTRRLINRNSGWTQKLRDWRADTKLHLLFMARIIRLLIPAALVLIAWLVWPYLESPKAQVERQQRNIIGLAADRDWDEVRACLALEYEDQWSMNRTDAVALAEELLQGFIMLDIEWTAAEITVNENIAKVRGTAKLSGNGAGVSTLVKERVNQLTQPWVFTWRKDGGKPDDWKLLSVRNAGLGGPLPENALK